MIDGFEEETAVLNDFEKSLVAGFVSSLSNKIGKGNAVTGKHIISMYRKQNIKLSGARVRKIINHIRINDLVSLLCSTSKGYYVANNQEEIKSYLKGLKTRIDAQKHVYKSLENQYNNNF